MTDALGLLLQVNGVTYEWKEVSKNRPAGTQLGVIAQDVEKVFPSWVSETPDGTKVLNIDQRTQLGVIVESFRTLKGRADAADGRLARAEVERISFAPSLLRLTAESRRWRTATP